MTPQELLGTARSLASSANRRLGASRFLAAALLVRQALEDALRAFWRQECPGVENCSWRVQLVSLPFFLNDSDLAGSTVSAWYRLSTMCHYDRLASHTDLTELEGLLDVVDRFVVVV